jgi:FkbM family methyltransferase
MGSLVDRFIGMVRPLPVRGKGRALDWLAPRAGMRTVRVCGDAVMTLNLANAIHRMIYIGCFSPNITACLRALLPPGGTFLDVGANVGYFSLMASQFVGREGRVLAVEPNPRAFEALSANLSQSHTSNVQADMIALGESEGTLGLYVPPADENRDYNVTIVANPSWTRIEVPCRRLDWCLADWHTDRIDLMKMDVEGAEPRVLAGGSSALADGVVRHLMLEINGPYLTELGSSPRALVDQLAELGFVPARLSGRRAIAARAERWDLDPAHAHDRLFVHRSALS